MLWREDLWFYRYLLVYLWKFLVNEEMSVSLAWYVAQKVLFGVVLTYEVLVVSLAGQLEGWDIWLGAISEETARRPYALDWLLLLQFRVYRADEISALYGILISHQLFFNPNEPITLSPILKAIPSHDTANPIFQDIISAVPERVLPFLLAMLLLHKYPRYDILALRSLQIFNIRSLQQ